MPVIAPTPNVPAKVTPVVPVGIEITSASASFLIVTSLVEPCPVKMSPSALVYPTAALSLAAVSPVGSIVVPIIAAEPVRIPVTPKVVLTVAAPVTARVEPSKVKFASLLTDVLSTDVITLLLVELL